MLHRLHLQVVIGVKVVAPVDTREAVVTSEPLEIIKFQMPVQRETVAVEGMTSAPDMSERRPVARILTERDMKQLVSDRLSPYLIRHAGKHSDRWWNVCSPASTNHGARRAN